MSLTEFKLDLITKRILKQTMQVMIPMNCQPQKNLVSGERTKSVNRVRCRQTIVCRNSFMSSILFLSRPMKGYSWPMQMSMLRLRKFKPNTQKIEYFSEQMAITTNKILLRTKTKQQNIFRFFFKLICFVKTPNFY